MKDTKITDTTISDNVVNTKKDDHESHQQENQQTTSVETQEVLPQTGIHNSLPTYMMVSSFALLVGVVVYKIMKDKMDIVKHMFIR